MNVLLDECTPRVLKRLLSELEIATVREMGWMGITNGALLGLAEGQFDVFITTDKNLRYQQNLSERAGDYPVTNESSPGCRVVSTGS